MGAPADHELRRRRELRHCCRRRRAFATVLPAELAVDGHASLARATFPRSERRCDTAACDDYTYMFDIFTAGAGCCRMAGELAVAAAAQSEPCDACVVGGVLSSGRRSMLSRRYPGSDGPQCGLPAPGFFGGWRDATTIRDRFQPLRGL